MESAKNKKTKFIEGDWVTIKTGLDKGISFTITDILRYGKDVTYYGFHCGRKLWEEEKNLKHYK